MVNYFDVSSFNKGQEREQKHALVSERCKKCVYVGGYGTRICCDYILYTKERRGCPAGDKCDKFKKATRKNRRSFPEEV